MNMNMNGFPMMKIGTSRIDSMRSFFDTSVIPQFYAPTAQIGSVPSSVSGGMIDPQSIVPGLGFGADNLPQPPTLQDTMQLLQMYQGVQGNSESYLNGISQEALAKKEQVFQSYHYEFGEDGNPVLDEQTGKPKVVDGAEDMFGKFQRLNWENQLMDKLDQKQGTEFASFEESANSTMNALYADSSSMFDPAKMQQRTETIESLEKQEKLLYVSQRQEKLQELMGHLPNPDKPGEEMGAFLDQGFAKYGEMAANDENSIMNSEVGQKFQNYFEAVSQFIENQQKIWSAYNIETFDPNAMKNFASKMKLV